MNCTFCSDLIPGCNNCIDNSNCAQCYTDGMFIPDIIPDGQVCRCKDGWFLTSNGTCGACDPSCLTCMSNATYCLTCNSSSLRQFNNNSCSCVTPFEDCRNSTLSGCDPQNCMYLSAPTLNIIKLIKDPTSNSMTYTISISPTASDFNNFDFSSILSLGLPSNTAVSITYSSGVITAEVGYS